MKDNSSVCFVSRPLSVSCSRSHVLADGRQAGRHAARSVISGDQLEEGGSRNGRQEDSQSRSSTKSHPVEVCRGHSVPNAELTSISSSSPCVQDFLPDLPQVALNTRLTCYLETNVLTLIFSIEFQERLNLTSDQEIYGDVHLCQTWCFIYFWI